MDIGTGRIDEADQEDSLEQIEHTSDFYPHAHMTDLDLDDQVRCHPCLGIPGHAYLAGEVREARFV